jgi:hypothetical protein
MARRYTRDNRGRFASAGATARGGRLKTASGNKRKTQTMKAAGGGGAGVMKGRTARTVAGQKVMGKLAKRPEQAKAAPKASVDAADSQRPASPSAPKRLKFNMLYHGTSMAASKAIRSGGFRESSSGLFGKGVYATAQKATAKLYQNPSAPAMLRLRALVGGRAIATATANKQQKRRLSNIRANTKRLTPALQGMYWPQTPSRIAVLPAAVANKLLDRSTGKIPKKRTRS